MGHCSYINSVSMLTDVELHPIAVVHFSDLITLDWDRCIASLLLLLCFRCIYLASRLYCVCFIFSIQEDSEAVLPRVVPSTFVSPAGNKIVELLMYFSTYVLLKISQHEHGK